MVKRLTCAAFNVHVSAPYNSTANTVAWYTACLVAIDSVELPKMGHLKQPKTQEALAILHFTSSKISQSLDTTEPR